MQLKRKHMNRERGGVGGMMMQMEMDCGMQKTRRSQEEKKRGEAKKMRRDYNI
jgi:hypothetical protein